MSPDAYSSPSLPASPLSDYNNELPIIATNELGMAVEVEVEAGTKVSQKRKRRQKQQDVKVVRSQRGSRKYVSKHFTQTKPMPKPKPKSQQESKSKSSSTKTSRRKRIKVEDTREEEEGEHTESNSLKASSPKPEADNHASPCAVEDPQSQSSLKVDSHSKTDDIPRIFFGLNVNELSSDSELSDTPSDLDSWPDPFAPNLNQTKSKSKQKPKPKPKHTTKSPYFPTQRHKQRSHFLTTLPFPSLADQYFGLMQERLAHDPYRLLLATIFLNKTPGSRAMPIFFDLMRAYPTPSALADAPVPAVTSIIHTLGFQNQRARKCVAFAKGWVDHPPCRGRRYRKLNYPCKGDGRDVGVDEVLPDEDDEVDDDSEGDAYGDVDRRKTRVAWEISHLPGLGPYSHDSWRMFCRDEMRGLATDWLGSGSGSGHTNTDTDDKIVTKRATKFEPEWKRVLPQDKELRAWMTWMWLKEGWVWNKDTGERTKADDELLRMARDGGVVQETAESDHLVVKGVQQETWLDQAAKETPAGEFMPG